MSLSVAIFGALMLQPVSSQYGRKPSLFTARRGQNAVFVDSRRFAEAFPTLRCILVNRYRMCALLRSASGSQVSLDNPLSVRQKTHITRIKRLAQGVSLCIQRGANKPIKACNLYSLGRSGPCGGLYDVPKMSFEVWSGILSRPKSRAISEDESGSLGWRMRGTEVSAHKQHAVTLGFAQIPKI